MSFLDRLMGRAEPEQPTVRSVRPLAGSSSGADGSSGERSPDDVAVERYRYMLRTAPPEDIERAHAEAFANLTPQQRQMVLQELSAQVPPSERARGDDPRDLAHMATRAEMRGPGTMERTFGSVGSGPGMGYAGPGLGSMFLTTLAASFVGTAIAQSFFAHSGYDQGFGQGYEAGHEAGSEQSAGDGGDTGSEGAYGADAGYGSEGDYGGDQGGGDFGGADFAGGDFGGDFGGGDFGGGDF